MSSQGHYMNLLSVQLGSHYMSQLFILVSLSCMFGFIDVLGLA